MESHTDFLLFLFSDTEIYDLVSRLSLTLTVDLSQFFLPTEEHPTRLGALLFGPFEPRPPSLGALLLDSSSLELCSSSFPFIYRSCLTLSFLYQDSLELCSSSFLKCEPLPDHDNPRLVVLLVHRLLDEPRRRLRAEGTSRHPVRASHRTERHRPKSRRGRLHHLIVSLELFARGDDNIDRILPHLVVHVAILSRVGVLAASVSQAAPTPTERALRKGQKGRNTARTRTSA